MSKKQTAKKQTRNKRQSWTQEQKEKLAYKIMLFSIIGLLAFVVIFSLLGGIKTITTFSYWHNKEMRTPDVWSKIASQWWSLVRVVSKTEDFVKLDLSALCISLIVIASVAAAALIPSIVLVARNKETPKKKTNKKKYGKK